MELGIFNRTKAYIEKYHMVAPGDTVVAGVSGGADSVCLFLLLVELRKEIDFQLIAVHVNHGIRDEAAQDGEFVRKLCEERELPFFLVEEDVGALAQREGMSQEEAGRKVRYQAFETVLKKYTGEDMHHGKIAVAHNANDRAETMLFHLFRGTGLSGAGGIRPVRDNIIRPILCLQRQEIEEYLQEKQMTFCIDSTNSEDTYTRNRIRKHILPYAEKEICRGTVRHMCETADIFLETEGYIKEQTEKAYERCMLSEDHKGIVLEVNKIKQENPYIRRQLILSALEKVTQRRRDITSLHIKAIEELLDKEGTRQTSLPYGLTVSKSYNSLILTKNPESQHREEEEQTRISIPHELEEGNVYRVTVPGLGMVEVAVYGKEFLWKNTENSESFLDKSKDIPQKSCTKWFDYDKITKSLIFRTRETGDYLTINKKMSTKTLKDYMIGEKIPKNLRGSIYILTEGSHVLWVPGYRISEYYKITEDTKRILQVQLRGGL